MRFLRGCGNKKEFPIELADRFSSKESRAKLFVDWLNCGEDFGKVLVEHRKRAKSTKAVEQKFGYRTKAQLMEMFQNNKVFVEELCRKKIQEGKWMHHTEVPNLEEFNLYWVRLSTEFSDTSAYEESTDIVGRAELDKTGVERLSNMNSMLPAIPGMTPHASTMAIDGFAAPDMSTDAGKGGKAKPAKKKTKESEGNPEEAKPMSPLEVALVKMKKAMKEAQKERA